MDLTFFEYVIRYLLKPESMARVFVLVFCIFWGKFIRDMLHAILPIPLKISVNEEHAGPELRADEASVSKKKKEAPNTEMRNAQLNGQFIVPTQSLTSEQFARADLYEQERADYIAKIERLVQELDVARSKLRSSDEICETALLLTSQNKNKFAGGDAVLARKWAENELKNKKKAKLRAAKNAKFNGQNNSKELIAHSIKESRKIIPTPVSKRIRILIDKIHVDMAIDTRCRFSCINKTLWQELGEPELLPISFNEWSGNQVARRGLIDVLRGKRIKFKLDWKDVMGYFIARVKINEKDYGCPLLVFDKPEIPNFIGKSWFQTLELASINAFKNQRPERLKRKRK
ncbi:hypothetical protein GHT06_021313 [Daphnia sinensis]|uniref:Uncharacterized protein n=1 Tax=Daphnia sinensis TaxID=1820382 RepID=A0AAD5PSF1_9CRUS|nr:hypothetical protein GHT06_021313 [Daphnia sinensis]